PGNPLGGGGGISLIFSRPVYQNGIPTCPMLGSLPSMWNVMPEAQRQVPDVAFTSATGSHTYPLFVECTLNGGDCGGTGGAPKFAAAGGTSFATPAFAGVVALMSQAAGGRLGNLNFLLYDLAANTPSAFHDITTGNNAVLCGTADPGCSASGTYG